MNLSSEMNWERMALAPCPILYALGAYLSLVFCFGVVLNGFVLYVLTEKNSFRSPIKLFIFALSFSDLLHALLSIPLPTTSNFACRWLHGKYFCYYEAFIAYFVGMLGLYLLTTLSMNRYLLIVKSNQSTKATLRTAHLSIIFSIGSALFWAITPIFGWNEYTLEGVLTSCSIRWQGRTVGVISYNILLFIFGYIIPLVIIIYCNTKIYGKIHSVTKRRVRWNRTTVQIAHTGRKPRLEKRLGRTVICIIISFIISWTPYAIMAFIASFISPRIVSPLAGTLPAIFAKSSIYFNPLIYIVTNYRHGRIRTILSNFSSSRNT